MKTSIKKSFVLPVIVVVIAVLVACPSQAQFTYISIDGTYVITLYNGSDGTVLTIPSSLNGVAVTGIASGVFYQATNLTAVMIPNTVTQIGVLAFTGCSALTNITVDPLNSAYSSADGVLFDRNQTTLLTYPGGKTGSYTIPNSVTNIGSWAFDSCTTLTSLTIPNSITSVGAGAFLGCTSLASVMIPNGVNGIQSQTFSGCTSLTNVTIPDSVTTIGDSAFWGCTSLTRITIPRSVTSFQSDFAAFTFVDCTNLGSIFFQGDAPSGADNTVFRADNHVTVYYLPGTSGWGSNFGGAPTAFWALPYPVILNRAPTFGLQKNQFGFTVSWSTNLPVLVAASTDLAKSSWSPVATNALHGGTFYFSDPQWKNYPSRFYRVTMFSGLLSPQLMITPSGSTLVLTWPSNFSGFTLQSTTNLGSSANWTALPPPVIVNGQYTVTNPISGTQQFFRLSQ
jgi:hypothetical protein